ncbi:aspartate aminotransferase [Lachnospiraceae bacterium XBB1006]|nr:aspartate aminotransferase [Lachnospiraceae bacterium XBB1006]
MLSKSMEKALGNSSAIREVFEYGQKLAQEIGEENVFDFSLGNPATRAPKKFDETIINLIQTTDSLKLHSYTDNSGIAAVRESIAANLNERFGTDFEAGNITMTVGAGGALNTVLRTIVDPEDEVIVFAPFFSEYVHYIGNYYGVPVIVKPNLTNFQPDMEDFKGKITSKTKAVIINTPNNPSGVVYKEETIKQIAEILSEKQKEFGKEIYLISDEPYRELLYDGAKHYFVTKYYDNTFVCYSFSKSLSLPGERIGYIAVSNRMADSKRTSVALKTATRILGFVNAPSLMQLAVKECLNEKTDLTYYETNRKILLEGLTQLGFTCVKPEGAFYLFLKSPIEDEIAFCEKAKEYNLMLVHGTSFACPGYVRLSYCVATEKIKRSLEQFAKLAKEYGL